jgi:hypothetical protein
LESLTPARPAERDPHEEADEQQSNANDGHAIQGIHWLSGL